MSMPQNSNTTSSRHTRNQLDINPATYYLNQTASSSIPNLASHLHSLKLHSSSHSDENKTGLKTASSSLLDLFSQTGTQKNTFAQQSCFTLMNITNKNENAINGNHSSLDLYVFKNSIKSYKHEKISNNIFNYMKYMTVSDEHGEPSQNQEGREEEEEKEGYHYEPQLALPPQTTFDSVRDIFNLVVPEQEQPKRKQMNVFDAIKEVTGNNETSSSEADDETTDGPPPTQIQTETGGAGDICTDDTVRRLLQILNEYDIQTLSDPDNDEVFSKVGNLCQDLHANKTKMQHIQHKYNDLESFLNRLKSENETLKQKNNELVNKLNSDAMTNENILSQLHESLHDIQNELYAYGRDTNADKQTDVALFNNIKLKLESVCESLDDLANDLKSEPLQCAAHKLTKSIDDIAFLQQHNLYKRSNLQNIINDLLKDLNGDNVDKHTKHKNEGNKVTKGGDIDMDDHKEDNNNNKLTKYGVFDDNYPVVSRIDIYGGWFNKKTRAIIKYDGKIFGRKEADFKWLYKMIQVNNHSDNDVIIPDFAKELPQVLWPNNYLTKRKSELNLFLMQCHSLKNVKNSCYWNIFLEESKESWKQKRDKFDKIMIQKIKQNNV